MLTFSAAFGAAPAATTPATQRHAVEYWALHAATPGRAWVMFENGVNAGGPPGANPTIMMNAAVAALAGLRINYGMIPDFALNLYYTLPVWGGYACRVLTENDMWVWVSEADASPGGARRAATVAQTRLMADHSRLAVAYVFRGE